MKKIYRTYNDTEVAELAVNVECPHCGNEFQVLGMDMPGETYVIECDEITEDGCGEHFAMHFDAS